MIPPQSRSFSLAAAVLLLAGMVHNHLLKSDPAHGARLNSSPKEIRLWFAERPEVALTSVTLMQADSTPIVSIKAVATPDSLVVSALLPTPLSPGSYLVRWRTASGDGHAVRGTFGFSISP